jgi:hypothetical protein
VKFGCPHCQQTYYGTGEKGHLVPTAFTCVTCSRPIRMDEMVLFPAEGVAEAQTKVDHFPWLHRKERSFWKSWFASLGMVMASPHRIMRAVPVDLPAGQTWWFALFSWLMFMLAGVGLPLMVIALIMAIGGDNDAIEPLLGAMAGIAGSMIGFFIYLAIWGLLTHGMLRLTGGSMHSIGRTYQAMCLSAGAFVIFAVPLVGPYCGIYLAWIWPAVSAIIMLRDGQQVHGGRATLAVLTFPGMLVTLAFAGYLVLMAMIFGGTGTFARAAAGSPSAQVMAVAQDIRAYSISHGGAGPVHGLELIDSPGMMNHGFVSPLSSTTLADVPVGTQTLDDLVVMPTNRQAAAIQAEIDAMPPNVVAHRVGDLVFTHHGIDFNTADPGLWIIVLTYDPAVNDSPSAATIPTLCAGLADGTVQYISLSQLAQDLKAQNDLRAASGLPPLPDPTMVLHNVPATAPFPPGASDPDADDEEP